MQVNGRGVRRELLLFKLFGLGVVGGRREVLIERRRWERSRQKESNSSHLPQDSGQHHPHLHLDLLSHPHR